MTHTYTYTTCRYYVDCEFIEDGHTIDLLSIGAVSSDGRQFYAENADADLTRASDWVKANVLPYMLGEDAAVDRKTLARLLDEFVSLPNVRPEFWSWCSAYDWVAICQLYGPMIAKPEGWPSYCRDIQQELDRLGIDDRELPEHPGPAHNALADAAWHRDICEWLRDRGGA
jgi:hypothetical protein